MLQVCEWKAMKYLVDSQSNRRVEQILYEHNHENIGLSIRKEKKENRESTFKIKPITYRRKEIQLSYKLYAFSTIVVLAYLVPRILAFKYGVIYKYLVFIYFPLLVIIMSVSWSQIFFVMAKKHRYEFEKSRKQMIVFFCISVFSVILCSVHFAIGFVIGQDAKYGSQINTTEEFSDFCQFDDKFIPEQQ